MLAGSGLCLKNYIGTEGTIKASLMPTYIVSACLAGLNTRYDGSAKLNKKVRELVEKGEAVPFCPEQAGGLPTPREQTELKQSVCYDCDTASNDCNCKAITISGKNITGQLTAGAVEMLKLAKMVSATKAILKARSPSCGVGSIYDGTFSGNITKGDGIAAAVLKASGIILMTEEDLKDDGNRNIQ
jgi:uncharacterized protein YbbK (DUF523 family)